MKASLGVLAVTLAACGGPTTLYAPPAPTAKLPVSNATAPAPSPASPLGARPEVPLPPIFLPPSPAVFTATSGITVWLVERHDVPIVSCDMTVPSGSSSDPTNKGGVAHAAASMLLRGAGARGAIDLARAIDDLGARIDASATKDASFVSLTVLKRSLGPAFALFSDVVARPRLDPGEFQRFEALWEDGLREREKDPDATARVVYDVAFFGSDSPYGHPTDGTPRSAHAVSLADVRRFHDASWRPDRATLVCAGDATRAELEALVDQGFRSWQAPRTPAPPPVVPALPPGPRAKVVFVDRADAPQVVLAVLGSGPAASDASEPALWRVNDAIGGSFASRLNQELREKEGFTYGARSFFVPLRGPGLVVSKADVVTAHAGDALGAMLSQLRAFATGGMNETEAARTRAQARGSLVGEYESVESIAVRLASDAALGLGPDRESRASRMRDSATLAQLDVLAKALYDPDHQMIVVVGPRKVVLPALGGLGLPPPEIRDAAGSIVASSTP